MHRDYRGAIERYRVYRDQTRELVEDRLFHELRYRVHVIAIDDDILRRVHHEWPQEQRYVDWSWERSVMPKLHTFGPRNFHAAFVVQGKICALMAARLSPAKRWLSLTYLEGCPCDHPLKGRVISVAVLTMLTFRAVVSDEQTVKNIGVRVLRPLDDALDCYRGAGFADITVSKKDTMIVIESPQRSAP